MRIPWKNHEPPALSGHEHSNNRSDHELRRRRLTYAIGSATASKISAVLLQLIAFPFALRTLGVDKYAVFIALQALLSWTSLLSLGLIPSLPKFIAGARAANDLQDQRNLVVWPLLWLSGVAVVLAAALALLGLAVPPYRLVSTAPDLPHSIVRTAYLTAVFISCVQQLTSVEAALRSGYQEFHYTSLISLCANLIVTGLLLLAFRHFGSISAFMLILYLPQAVLLLVDIGVLFAQRPYLLGRPTALRATFNTLSSQSANALFVQISVFLTVYLPPLIVAHLTNPTATAAFGTLIQMMMMGVASMNLIYQPLLAAISDAHSLKDWPWIERNYHRGLKLVVSVGLLAIVVLTAIGPWLLLTWLGRDIGITHELCFATGCLFALMSFSIYHFYVLSGAGLLRGAGWAYVGQGAIALALATLLCTHFGALGMMAGLAIGLLAVSSWYGPLRMTNAHLGGASEIHKREAI